MRYLLTIALLLTACGGERAATVDDGGGQADAGPVWSQVEGTYQWFDDPDATFPCDGGGFARYNGTPQTHPSRTLKVLDGGAITGCEWCAPGSELAPVVAPDGTVTEDDRIFGIIYGEGFTGPNGEDLDGVALANVRGAFHRDPPRSIDYFVDWTIGPSGCVGPDCHYCSGTMHVGEREVSAP